MNIQIEQEQLDRLTFIDLGNFKVTKMPVENIVANVSGQIEEESSEILYIFMTPDGNLLFRKINGIYQVSSGTGEIKLIVFRYFCMVADQNDINFTSTGFEPF